MGSRATLSFVTVVLAVIGSAQALQESAVSAYDSTVSQSCAPGCCGTCRAKYSMNGTWISEEEEPSSGPTCFMLCRKHFLACRKMCMCLTSRDSVRDSEKCKCTPPAILINNVLKNCRKKCISARNACRSGCTGSGPCAKATTTVDFSQFVCGNCGQVSCCEGTNCSPVPSLFSQKCSRCPS